MIPKTLITGDTFKSTVSYTTPSGFTLSFELVGPKGPDSQSRSYTVTNGELVIPATVTKTFLGGLYSWVLLRTDGTEVYTVDFGIITVEVRADLQTDHRKSHAVTALEAIEAVLESRATFEQSSYSIKDRSLSRHTLTELLELRKYYKELVNRENGKSITRQIRPLFRRL